MIQLGGYEWVTAEEARMQAGRELTDARLWQWKRRGHVIAHRVGKINLYRLDTVLDAEAARAADLALQNAR